MKYFLIEYLSSVSGKTRKYIERAELREEMGLKWFGSADWELKLAEHDGKITEVSAEFDADLIRRLDMCRDGTNSHTINKTASYYREGATPALLALLGIEIKRALASKDFKELGRVLMNYW
jgi:hypothetical protein